jgi:hypothetical protein
VWLDIVDGHVSGQPGSSISLCVQHSTRPLLPLLKQVLLRVLQFDYSSSTLWRMFDGSTIGRVVHKDWLLSVSTA